MVRISKLTDYAVVIMAYIAEVFLSKTNPNDLHLLQAREIASHTHLSLPTVSKLLKILTKHKFLNSLRGVNGGYQLATAPENVSIIDLIQALEGPFAITECNLGHQHCSSETLCAIRSPWLHINEMITKALSSIKLSDLVNGIPGISGISSSRVSMTQAIPLPAPTQKRYSATQDSSSNFTNINLANAGNTQLNLKVMQGEKNLQGESHGF